MLKVLTLIGTRPELIKMSRVIAELDRVFDHVLVHSGQNYDYELNQVFFDDLEIRKPDHFLGVKGDTPAEVIADIIARADAVLELERPDAVLLYGDTNTCLAVIAAKRRKIPVFHMEAGNRCFDQRVPEELNRKVVDHLSDINLVLTEHARRYLLAEGIAPQTIIKTGSHMNEVLTHYLPKIQASDATTRLGLTSGAFFLVSAHREETVDSDTNVRTLLDALNGLAEAYDYPVLVSTHPRTRKRLHGITADARIRFMPPFGFFDWVRLQLDCACVLSDSGTITEEASLLNLPAVTIRDTHERPEGMDVGTLVMSGLRRESVLDAVRLVLSQSRDFPPVADYQTTVSKQVARIVQSYTGYVNRTVWGIKSPLDRSAAGAP
jgi:UDP-N-acetylglucosamine 2-epimerase (non-hydrolysing)